MSLLTLALGGCGLYNTQAPPEKNKAAIAFSPEVDKAVIYVYRSSSLVAAIQAFRIYLDKQPLVDCTSGTFIRLVVEPGSHVVGVGHAGQFTPLNESVAVEATKGKLHYVKLAIGASPISGIPKLTLADEETAQREIKRCSLLELGLK